MSQLFKVVENILNNSLTQLSPTKNAPNESITSSSKNGNKKQSQNATNSNSFRGEEKDFDISSHLKSTYSTTNINTSKRTFANATLTHSAGATNSAANFFALTTSSSMANKVNKEDALINFLINNI